MCTVGLEEEATQGFSPSLTFLNRVAGLNDAVGARRLLYLATGGDNGGSSRWSAFPFTSTSGRRARRLVVQRGQLRRKGPMTTGCPPAPRCTDGAHEGCRSYARAACRRAAAAAAASTPPHFVGCRTIGLFVTIFSCTDQFGQPIRRKASQSCWGKVLCTRSRAGRSGRVSFAG